MNNLDFTTSFTVDQSRQEVFSAISNVRGWWSLEIEGSADALNDVLTHRYGDVHHFEMKITDLTPGGRIAWRVVDNYFNFVEDQTEWKGTEIAFDIAIKGDKTEVRFTHQGLVPEYECYETCSSAWGNYINRSLHDLITTGTGHPLQRRKANNDRS
jgi:uncharacterized protein YndB with AHSA1/START domain